MTNLTMTEEEFRQKIAKEISDYIDESGPYNGTYFSGTLNGLKIATILVMGYRDALTQIEEEIKDNNDRSN